MKFQDHVIWVTRASVGIGREVASQLARRGATVVISARRQDRLDSLVQEIESAGGTVRAIVCGVTKEKPAAILSLDRVGIWPS